MSPITTAAKTLYTHLVTRAGLAAPPSWESLSPEDRMVLVEEVRVALQAYFLALSESRDR